MDSTDPRGKAGTYRWNLTFAYDPTYEERKQARAEDDWNFSYNIVVVKNITRVTRPLQGDEYQEELIVEDDAGIVEGTAEMYSEKLSGSLLTLASSEDVLLSDEKVRDSVLNKRTGKIDWKECEYGIGLTAITGTGPGYQAISMLTGITPPASKYAWAVQKNTLYQNGETFSAGVDCETGQLLYVLQVKGTKLYDIFG
ncbi:MAG: hypothetical protein DRJ64_04605 [Thermoprotei archaeon]|nr:MAG: hypothetical protein DRJ64_04605 [Thermoprotei archaeon]